MLDYSRQYKEQGGFLRCMPFHRRGLAKFEFLSTLGVFYIQKLYLRDLYQFIFLIFHLLFQIHGFNDDYDRNCGPDSWKLVETKWRRSIFAYIRVTEAAHAQTAWPWNSSGGNIDGGPASFAFKSFLCNIGRVFWLYIKVCCLFFASLPILYNFELKETGKSQFYTPSISDLHPHACITWPRRLASNAPGCRQNLNIDNGGAGHFGICWLFLTEMYGKCQFFCFNPDFNTSRGPSFASR